MSFFGNLGDQLRDFGRDLGGNLLDAGLQTTRERFGLADGSQTDAPPEGRLVASPAEVKTASTAAQEDAGMLAGLSTQQLLLFGGLGLGALVLMSRR